MSIGKGNDAIFSASFQCTRQRPAAIIPEGGKRKRSSDLSPVGLFIV